MPQIVGIASWFMLLASFVLLSVDITTAADNLAKQEKGARSGRRPPHLFLDKVDAPTHERAGASAVPPWTFIARFQYLSPEYNR